MKPQNPASPDPSFLARQAASLRDTLQSADPTALAARTGAKYQDRGSGEGEFLLPLWGEPVRISFPGFIARKGAGEELSLGTRALLLYHFTTADGAPVAGQWISFSELPNGRFYNQAYQGYTGGELARVFGADLARFARAAARLGGVPQPFAGTDHSQESEHSLHDGPAAFAFQALPRLHLLAAAWPGDEDFPTSYQILFDASTSHQLPTDVCAILGSTLVRRLIAARKIR